MTGDDRLRSELEALERAAPAGGLPVVEAVRPRPWGRVGLIGGTVVAAVALTSFAIGLNLPLEVGSPPASANPTAPTATNNPPAVAETRVGDFILTISSPRSAWTTEESIEVSASLSYVGDEPDMTIGEGAPPISFTVRSATGQGVAVGTGQFRPCFRYPVSRDRPLVATLTKDRIVVEEGVPAASPFGQEFSENSRLQLDPGTWEFTATTTFAERTCGDDFRLEVSIVIEVGDAQTSSSPLPTPSVAPSESPVARDVCRDSNFDPIGHLVTRDDLERDLERLAAAVQDEPTYAGMYISDEKGPWSGLEAVLRTTSCNVEGLIPELHHPERLRIELVDRSFDDLRLIHTEIRSAKRDLAASGEEIAMFGLDTLANAVRVSYLKGSAAADIVEAGGVPPAFAAAVGTDGVVFAVIDQLFITLPVPGSPLPSVSEMPR